MGAYRNHRQGTVSIVAGTLLIFLAAYQQRQRPGQS
jgi:hypothetical protein